MVAINIERKKIFLKWNFYSFKQLHLFKDSKEDTNLKASLKGARDTKQAKYVK